MTGLETASHTEPGETQPLLWGFPLVPGTLFRAETGTPPPHGQYSLQTASSPATTVVVRSSAWTAAGLGTWAGTPRWNGTQTW